MFLTKQKKIEHLQEIIAFKEAEIKAMKNERQAEKRRLFAALNENLKLKRRVEICDGMTEKQIQNIKRLKVTLEKCEKDNEFLRQIVRETETEINELEGRLDDAEQVQLALERDARQKRQRIYAACAKMRRQIKAQQQTIDVLQHNIHAIMATYEQCDDRNRQLEGLTREQGGRLAVYEKLVGEIPRHEEVSE
jgi:chromosome segregation ATPase